MSSQKEEKSRFDLYKKICLFIQDEKLNSFELAREFNLLALELFSYQSRANPVYRKISQLASQLTKREPSVFSEIPLLAISLFKSEQIFSLEQEQVSKIFYSSGTTQKNRSRHFLSEKELSLYQVSLYKNFKRAFMLSEEFSSQKTRYLALTESQQDKPNNSLVYMFDYLRAKLFKINDPKECFLLENLNFRFELLESSIERAFLESKQILLVGTSLLFKSLLEQLRLKKIKQLVLPKDSAIMQTGGFKNEKETISPARLKQELGSFFALRPEKILDQYGMSETGTQFYDYYEINKSLNKKTNKNFNKENNEENNKKNNSSNFVYREKLIPHWCQIRILDPRNLKRELPVFETGLIAIYDLTNLDSCAFILTEDLGFKTTQNTFQVVGRVAQADLKGCSLNYQEL